MSTLYELASEIEKLETQCDIAEDAGTDLSEFLDRLNAIEMTGDEKAQNVIAWVISLEVEAEGIRSEIDRLVARRHARQRKAEALRAYLGDWLRATGRTKFKTELATAHLSKGRERVDIDAHATELWPAEVLQHARAGGAVREEVFVSSKKLAELFPELWRDLPGVNVSIGKESLTIR